MRWAGDVAQRQSTCLICANPPGLTPGLGKKSKAILASLPDYLLADALGDRTAWPAGQQISGLSNLASTNDYLCVLRRVTQSLRASVLPCVKCILLPRAMYKQNYDNVCKNASPGVWLIVSTQ